MHPFVPDYQSLIDLRNLFWSACGPKGRLKVFVTAAEALRVTSTSDRIVENLLHVVQCPLAESVLYAVKSHLRSVGDGGLQLGGFILELLSNDFPDFAATRTFAEESLKNAFDRQVIKIDVSSANQMLALTRSILGSKALDVTAHSIKILEAFLTSLPSELNSCVMCKLNLNVVSSQDQGVQFMSGVVHPFPEKLETKEIAQRTNCKLLLMNVQLKNHMKEMSEVQTADIDLKYSQEYEEIAMKTLAERLAAFCLKNGVDVVANQRVICPELQEVFSKSGLFAIERLGTVTTQRLQCLSGAKIVTDLEGFLGLESHEASGFFGHLDRISYPTILGKPCIHFESTKQRCATVLVTHFEDEKCEELKVMFLTFFLKLFKTIKKVRQFSFKELRVCLTKWMKMPHSLVVRPRRNFSSKGTMSNPLCSNSREKIVTSWGMFYVAKYYVRKSA